MIITKTFQSAADRIENTFLIPIKVFDVALDIGKVAVGVTASALSILTFGKREQTNRLANRINASTILPNLYLAVLTVINPDAEFELSGIGWITSEIALPIVKKAGDLAADNDSFFNRHFVSRGAYVLGAVVASITRVVDLILSAFGIAFSLITFGSVKEINSFALDQLSFLEVIQDICIGARGLVNPQQFVNGASD